jgi:transcriptional regulator with XRE-family HTH domain
MQPIDEKMGEIGRRIAAARVARGWTQRQLAEAAGVHRKTVTAYESGVCWPSLAAFVRLCLALEVPPADMLDHADVIWPLAEVEREAVLVLRQIAPERRPRAIALLRAMVVTDGEPEKSG